MITNTPSPFVLKPAGPEDAAVIQAVTLEIWRPRVSAQSTVFRETPDTVAAQLARGGGVLAICDGVVVGSGRFVMVEGPAGDDRPWMEVKRIGLLPGYTGQGGGELICTHLETMGRDKGAVGAQLAVRADQLRLVDVWAALGYTLADDVELTTPNPNSPPPIGMRKRF